MGGGGGVLCAEGGDGWGGVGEELGGSWVLDGGEGVGVVVGEGGGGVGDGGRGFAAECGGVWDWGVRWGW